MGTGEIIRSTKGNLLIIIAHNFTEAQINVLLENGAQIGSPEYFCRKDRNRDSYEAVLVILLDSFGEQELINAGIGIFNFGRNNTENLVLPASWGQVAELSTRDIAMRSYAGLTNN